MIVFLCGCTYLNLGSGLLSCFARCVPCVASPSFSFDEDFSDTRIDHGGQVCAKPAAQKHRSQLLIPARSSPPPTPLLAPPTTASRHRPRSTFRGRQLHGALLRVMRILALTPRGARARALRSSCTSARRSRTVRHSARTSTCSVARRPTARRRRRASGPRAGGTASTTTTCKQQKLEISFRLSFLESYRLPPSVVTAVAAAVVVSATVVTAALVIAPASPLFAPPIIAAAPTPITFAATIVAPPIVAPAPSAAPRCAGERSVPRRHPQPRAGRVQGERGRRREEIAQ